MLIRLTDSNNNANNVYGFIVGETLIRSQEEFANVRTRPIAANGGVLVANAMSGGFDATTIAQGPGLVVTSGAGSLTIDATPAFNKANGAYDHANASFAKANSVSANILSLVTDNVPETTTNLYFTSARVRSNISNTAPINYNSTTGVISHADSSVTPTTYGNSSFVSQITIDSRGHITSASNVAIDQTLAQTARDHANGAFNKANAATSNSGVTVNGSILIGNTVSGGFDLRTITQGTGITVTNGQGTITIAATGGSALDQFARDQANAAFDKANSAGLRANTLVTDNVPETTTNLYFTAARVRANISNTAPINYDSGTGTFSHALSGVTATGYGDAASIPVFVVNSTGHLTAVTNTSIAISASQITSGTLSVARGGTGQTAITVNGAVLIANTVSGGYDVNRITQTAPVIVTNDKGSITLSHASSGVTPTTYGSGLTVAQVTVDAFGHVTSASNVAIDQSLAQTARDHANGAFTTANSAYAHANASFAKANAATPNTATANGQIYAGNTVSGAFDLTTIAQTAPVIVTNGRGTVTLSHASSGVVATTYGNATHSATVTVDQFGHSTSITNTLIGISASQITSGTLAVNRGGTGQTSITVNGSLLIGNTVSGGYDVNTLTQGTGITITNDKGSITIAASGGSALDQFARDTANGAFTTANSAYAQANSAFNKANAAVGNTGVTVNGSIHIGNTVSGGYDVRTITQGFGVTITNGQGTITIDAFDQFARDRANGAYTTANGAYAQANSSFNTANAATPNTATANGQIYAGNTVSGKFDLTTISQTAPVIVTNGRGTVTLSHASSGVVATTYGNAGFVPTVTVDQFGHITTATNTAISITTASVSEAAGGPFYHNSARVRGNVTNTAPINYDPATGTFSHALSGVVATGYGDGATIPKIVVDDKGHVTSVTNTSVAISASQITSGILSVARGGTGKDATGLVNGALLVGNTVNSGFDLVTIAQTAPVIVTNGKGTVTLSHASSGVVATGYGTAAQVPVFVVDQFGHVTSVTNTAISITTASVSESAGGPFYHTSARVRGNVTNTAPINYDSGTGTFSHALSGVVATGYGTVNTIPVFTVSDSGHVTSVVNTAIAITAAQVTSGTLSVARGGTGQTAASIVNGAVLIGNTVSGGYDVNPLTQGTGIVITNDKGSITIAATGGSATDQFARDTANGAYAQANAAFNKANAAVANTGVTTNGSLLIGNTVSGGFDLQTLTQGSGITITNGQGTITIASTGGVSNSFSTINTISIDANTQGNLVAIGADTLILEAGPGMNISFSVVDGDKTTFAVNPGYIQAISSGQALYAL